MTPSIRTGFNMTRLSIVYVGGGSKWIAPEYKRASEKIGAAAQFSLSCRGGAFTITGSHGQICTRKRTQRVDGWRE